jgi:pimeloyl-ACP methyl ester carboxylesterase
MTAVDTRGRLRRFRGTEYVTARQRHGALTVAVERFPGPGERSGRSYVLVHGIGVSSRYFHPLAVELARTGMVHLVDLPGYGAAPDPRRDVSIADHAAVLAAFLRGTGIDNPVLVGHSWGCEVVAALAEQHPDVSDRIVLMAPTLEPRARTAPRAIGRLLLDGLREPPHVSLLVTADYLFRCGVPYLVRQMPHMLRDRIEDRVGAHGSDVLVIAGDRDPIAPPAWSRRLAEAAGGRYREVEGPHVVMYSDPVRVAAAIREFVDAT